MTANGIRGIVAEFATVDGLVVGARLARERGFTEIEAYSPFDIPQLTAVMERRRSRLPIVVFVAAIVGAVASYAVQWYTNVWSYPQNAGGRPPHAVPAFILSTFEGMVLVAALAAFAGFLFLAGLPRLWHPVFEVEGFTSVSNDRFWLEVRGLTDRYSADQLSALLTERGALRVAALEMDS